MTEQEVLEKLTAYKDAILKIKQERDELKVKYATSISENNELKKQLETIQLQSQQSKSKDDEARNAFMNELDRVLKEADDVLKDDKV